MLTMYDKSDLEYHNGYIVNEDNKVIGIPFHIVEFINKLDRMLQFVDFIDENPCKKEGDLPQFEQKHERKQAMFKKADTPVMDKKVKESLAMIDEINRSNLVDKMNKFLSEHAGSMQFISESIIVDRDIQALNEFDVPAIGDPLDLREAEALSIIKRFFTLCDEHPDDPRIKAAIDTIFC